MKLRNENTSKILVIVGPTASGKSDLAIALARQYNGEIISADSRQVYRGMDVGSGKVPRDRTGIFNFQFSISKQSKKNIYLSGGIRHHLLDVASPKRNYNVTHFVRDAKKAIADIKKRGKVPIICGGTEFWIQALIEDSSFPAVKPDMKLRKKLGVLSAEKLFAMLGKKDPRRAKTIDAKNKVRLIRALEICQALGSVPPLFCHPEQSRPRAALALAVAQGSVLSLVDSSTRKLARNDKENFLIIALNPNKVILQKNIEIRLNKRLKNGMFAEVKRLHEEGVSWKRLESFGLEYRWCAAYLQKKVSRQDLKARLPNDIWHYAKRQLSFLRRFEKMSTTIHWVAGSKEANKIVRKNIVVIPAKAGI